MRVPRCILLAFLVPAITVPPTPAPAETAGELSVAAWSGSVLARRIDGAVAVLSGTDGSLRWEIATAPDTTLADLLERQGRGWTVVAGPDGQGTRNAWGEEWRPLEVDLARTLAAATRAALAIEVPGEVIVREDTGSLRARLACRGTGRGGPGEVLRLARDGRGATTMTSSRRPGALRLEPWRRLTVRYPVRESFTPLWPLAELLEFPDEYGNPGE